MGGSKRLAGLLATLALWSSPALAADHLECIESGNSAEQNAYFQNFVDRFHISELSGGGRPPAEMMEIIQGRADACASQHNWSREAAEHSVLFRLTKVLQTALRAHMPISEEQLARYDAIVAGADQARLRRIFGVAVEPAPANDADDEFLGELIARSGMPMTEANAKFAGAWLASVLVSKHMTEQFAAL